MPSRVAESILNDLKRRREVGEGQVRPVIGAAEPIGALDRFVEGIAGGVTAPLGIFGLDYEPNYGREGPGMAGLAGETLGSIATFIGAEAGLLRAAPILAGAGAAQRIGRVAATAGALEFGREPVDDQTRAGNAMVGAVSGAILGGMLSPRAGMVQSALGGAAATVPVAISHEMTGEETTKTAVYNALLVGLLSRLGGRVRSEASAESPFEGVPKGPAPAAPLKALPPGPITTPPPAGSQLDLPLPVRFDVSRRAEPPLVQAEIVTPEAQRQLQFPFGRDVTVAPVPSIMPELARPTPSLGARFVEESGQRRLFTKRETSRLESEQVRDFAPPSPPVAATKRLGRSELEALTIEAVKQDVNIGREIIRPGVYIDLGSGFGEEIRHGFIGVERSANPPRNVTLPFGLGARMPQLLHSLEKSLPFENSTVDAFNASRSLSRVKRPMPVYDDIHRTLRQGGLITAEDRAEVIEPMIANFRRKGYEILERVAAGTDEADRPLISVLLRKPIATRQAPSAIIPAPIIAKPRIIENRTVRDEAMVAEELAKRDPKISAARSRTVELKPETREAFLTLPPEDVPGFDGAGIKTVGLNARQLEELAMTSDLIGDTALARELRSIWGGLIGGRARAKAPRPVEPPPEQRFVAMEDPVRAIDESVNSLLDVEVSSQVRQILQRRKPFERSFTDENVGVAPVASWSDVIQQLRAGRIVPTQSLGDGRMVFTLPDKSTKTMTIEQAAEFASRMTPPTESVPVYQGPERPPLEDPIANVPPIWRQLEMPFGERPPEPKPLVEIPEPSADVVVKSSTEVKPMPIASIVESEASAKAVDVVHGKTESVGAAVRGFRDLRDIPPAVQEKFRREVIVLDDQLNGTRSVAESLKEAAEQIAANKNNAGRAWRPEELRSLFRRRFAAAKTGAERNRIRNKYRLYSEYFPATGEHIRVGESRLGSLDGLVDYRNKPIIDLTPEGAPPFGLPPMNPRPPAVGEPPPGWHHAQPEHVPGMWFTRYIREARHWMLDLEHRTGGRLPSFSRLWEPLMTHDNEMRSAAEPFLARLAPMWSKGKRVRGSGFRVGRWLEAKDKNAAIHEHGITPQEVAWGGELRKMWDELFTVLDFRDAAGKPLKGVDYIQDYLPIRRVHSDMTFGQINDRFFGGRLPKALRQWEAEMERTGQGVDVRETDAFKLMWQYILQGFRSKYMKRPVEDAAKWIEETSMAPGIREHLRTFVRHMRGIPDESVRATNEAIANVLQKMGVKLSEGERTDFTALLLQLSVGAHIGWRVPLIIRNSFQVTFVYPFLGGKYFGYGLRRAMTRDGWKEATRDGIIQAGEPVAFADEIFNPIGPWTQFIRKGTKGYKRVDDLTRVVGYLGMKQKVLDAGLKLTRGGSVDDFIRETELLSTLHPVEAKVVVEAARSGRIEEAAKIAGRYLQSNTNFVYHGANVPLAYRGVAGRLFGQFGLWPASYLEYVRYLFAFGTPEQRATKVVRFIAMNSAYGGLGTLMGVNLWKWLMFGPMVFTGGPILTAIQDAATVAEAAATGRDDVEANLARGRLGRDILSNVVPGAGMFRDVERALEARELLGRGAMATSLVTGQLPEEEPFAVLQPVQRRTADVVLEDLRRRRGRR